MIFSILVRVVSEDENPKPSDISVTLASIAVMTSD